MYVGAYETSVYKRKFLQHALSCYVYNRSLFDIFTQVENVKRGQKLELTYMPAGSCIWGAVSKYQNGTPKVARKAFAMGDRTVKLVLWSTLSRILLPRIKHFWFKLVEKCFFIIFEQNLVECRTSSLGYSNILYSWIYLERNIFEIIIHEIFLLARDWSKHVTWPNIPQLKLGNIQSAKTGEYPRIFPNFQNCARCEKDLKDTTASIWGENMLGYLSVDIICSS